LADIYCTEAVTDLAIKNYFLTTAVLAKETAKKLALIDNFDEMFDRLAVIQFPHEKYCRDLTMLVNINCDR